MSDLPIKATFKSGADYSAPWLTVDASDPADLSFKLGALLSGDVLAEVIQVSRAFQSVKTVDDGAGPVAPVAQQHSAPAQQQPAGWSTSAAPAPSWGAGQQQAAPQGGGGNRPGAQLHPEGKGCELPGCGNVLEFKKTQTGKSKWQCPEWRWNNGNPNGHSSEFVN